MTWRARICVAFSDGDEGGRRDAAILKACKRPSNVLVWPPMKGVGTTATPEEYPLFCYPVDFDSEREALL
jgi:hypothetical protein